jgi:hypothetical protein
MTGEELYAERWGKIRDRGIMLDTWDQLPAGTRAIWNERAKKGQEAEPGWCRPTGEPETDVDCCPHCGHPLVPSLPPTGP